MFTRLKGYTVLKSVFSSTVSQMQSGLLCSSFSCVTLLREALVYFYSVCDSELLRCQSSKRAKLYVPKSRNLADLPAVKLINRKLKYAIKLINRQLTYSIFQGYTVQASTVFRITQLLSSGLHSFKVLSIKL